MPVEPVGNSVSDMRGSVENTLSRERASFLRKEKRRHCDTGDNCDRSFHLLSLLFLSYTRSTPVVFESFPTNLHRPAPRPCPLLAPRGEGTLPEFPAIRAT